MKTTGTEVVVLTAPSIGTDLFIMQFIHKKNNNNANYNLTMITAGPPHVPFKL